MINDSLPFTIHERCLPGACYGGENGCFCPKLKKTNTSFPRRKNLVVNVFWSCPWHRLFLNSKKSSKEKVETCTHIFPKTKWTGMKTTHDSDFQSSLQTRSPQRKLFLDLTSTTKQTLYPVKYLTVNQCYHFLRPQWVQPIQRSRENVRDMLVRYFRPLGRDCPKEVGQKSLDWYPFLEHVSH